MRWRLVQLDLGMGVLLALILGALALRIGGWWCYHRRE